MRPSVVLAAPARRLPTLALLAALAALALPAARAHAGPRALFDNTHAETAGNADWIIDTDQPLPLPDQFTVTPATPRTYWLGAISSYGIDLVKRGYFVATLVNSPADSALGITYQNPANKYDLSRFDVFIIPEPNTRFSAAESTAIFHYVSDGGGLVFITDHWNSDRNSDGADSPEIFDYLDAHQLWGAHADTSGEANNNIVQDSGNYNTSPSDAITHGPEGLADSLAFHNGTTFVLNLAANPTAQGEFWMNGTPQGATNNVMAGSSQYGQGRVFFIGDSSPVDDGSAQPGNSSIFDGWGEVSGRDSLLFVNATRWVTRVPPFVIHASAGPNGTITPAGDVSVPPGADQAFTISPDPGYLVTDVTVDGVSVGADTSYTFQAVEGNHTIAATFGSATGVDSPTGGAVLALRGALPNPTAGPTTLVFSLPATCEARLEIVDVRGRVVWAMHARLGPGAHAWTWDGRANTGARVRAGLYFVRLSTPFGARAGRFVRVE